MDVRRGPLVFACDGGYAMPLATALRSLVDADPSGTPHDVHILCQAFPDALRDRVVRSLPPGSAKVTWIEPDLSRFDRFYTSEYPSKMVYARLLIPEIFPESVSRALYLDADILVLGSLSALWATQFGDHVIAAVLDGLDEQIKSAAPGATRLPRVRRYFNSGVLLLDLERMRAERVLERALAYLETAPGSPFPDQDALNVACDGAWYELPERWNHHVTKWNGAKLVETDLLPMRSEDKPSIAHFATSLKPWIPSSLSRNAAFYDHARAKTRFSRSLAEHLRDHAASSLFRVKRGVRGLAAAMSQATKQPS